MRPKKRTPARGRAQASRRSAISWRWRLAVAIFLIVALLTAWAALARHLASEGNTARERFDAIVVFGAPTGSDGRPTPTQLARVAEAVREYERGRAPWLILTGGPAHNGYVEAQTMAALAHAEGVPNSRILLETQARDTLQNGCYALRILRAHGWRSAELVSSAAHLPRIALIFDDLTAGLGDDRALEWRLHAAEPLRADSTLRTLAEPPVETLKTLRYLLWARRTERCQP